MKNTRDVSENSPNNARTAGKWGQYCMGRKVRGEENGSAEERQKSISRYLKQGALGEGMFLKKRVTMFGGVSHKR